MSCCAEDGAECTRPDCLMTVDFVTAAYHCASYGLRLCTEAEFNLCSTVGCQFDYERNWSSDECLPTLAPTSNPTTDPTHPTHSPTNKPTPLGAQSCGAVATGVEYNDEKHLIEVSLDFDGDLTVSLSDVTFTDDVTQFSVHEYGTSQLIADDLVCAALRASL